jgi:hypothetical protein
MRPGLSPRAGAASTPTCRHQRGRRTPDARHAHASIQEPGSGRRVNRGSQLAAPAPRGLCWPTPRADRPAIRLKITRKPSIPSQERPFAEVSQRPNTRLIEDPAEKPKIKLAKQGASAAFRHAGSIGRYEKRLAAGDDPHFQACRAWRHCRNLYETAAGQPRSRA